MNYLSIFIPMVFASFDFYSFHHGYIPFFNINIDEIDGNTALIPLIFGYLYAIPFMVAYRKVRN
ncbi:hypothetical protein AAFN90_13615 [Erwiniaceae bacterium CAU 1747]